MEKKQETKTKNEQLTYLNNFILRLNQKIMNCSKNSIPIVTDVITAICDRKISLLKVYSYNGLPDDIPLLRAFIWKILLNYLPEDPKKWEETLTEKRALYFNYKKIIEEKLESEFKEKNYESKSVLEQIMKDVYRTNPKISFFYEPTNKNLKNKIEQIRKYHFFMNQQIKI